MIRFLNENSRSSQRVCHSNGEIKFGFQIINEKEKEGKVEISWFV